jgi:hypothetical protein
MKLLIAITLLGMLSWTAYALVSDKPHDGYWWESIGHQGPKEGLEEERKMSQLDFIIGYVEGRESIIQWARLFEKRVGDEKQKKVWHMILEFDLTGITYGQLRDGVTEFYSDFRNKQLPFENAISIVADEARGEKREYIECRKEFSRLLSQPGKGDEAMKRWDECTKIRSK